MTKKIRDLTLEEVASICGKSYCRKCPLTLTKNPDICACEYPLSSRATKEELKHFLDKEVELE